MADDRRSARQRALLSHLQEAERKGRPIDLDEAAQAAGYSPSSIRTYFSKRLEGVLVVRDEQGQWWAKGARACSLASFSRRMSQKAGSASEVIKSQEGWRELLRRLLYEGARRHYVLSDHELEMIEQLRPDPPDDAEDEEAMGEGASQPSLFGSSDSSG